MSASVARRRGRQTEGGRALPLAELLESRRLLSVVRPDHVLVVIEQDRASDAIGNALFPYLNSIASTGLVYSNAHGVTHPSEPNTLAMYSGSTQGITDNNRGYSFSGPNLAKSLFSAGLSFSGYVENLPADGSQVTQAGDSQYPDLYTRNLNAMAQFTDVGTLATGAARPNAAVNRTFNAFKSIPAADYSTLPAVSYVIPNNLHSTHGSNEAYPWAGSSDEQNNNVLRKAADDWLKANIDPYLRWAQTHNSLLIVTQDEERWTGGTSQTVTTLINGDPRLFVAGTNPSSVNHYNVLRTIEDMFSLPLLNNTANAAPLATDAQGRLAPSPSTTPAPTPAATTTALSSSANPSSAGQAVTFTATVTTSVAGSGVASGTVTFKDGSAILGTAPLDANARAVFTTGALTTGSHSITAVYGGNASFAASTSPVLTQQVASASATPVNDLFANRIVLSGTSATASGTNVKATKEPGEPRHAGNVGGRSVWWTWTAPASGTATIDTVGSNFDTLLGVYTGAGVSALSPVASNDDIPGTSGGASRVSFAAVAGRTYQIAVDGYGGLSGSITLHVSLPSSTTTTTTAAPSSLLASQTLSPAKSKKNKSLLA